MSLTIRRLGDVLLHIYEFNFGAAIYVPELARYEGDTPCVVAGGLPDDPDDLDQACRDAGFKNWFNVAVVSDTCDDVSDRTESGFIAAFNKDCEEGGWLRKMMNYRHANAS